MEKVVNLNFNNDYSILGYVEEAVVEVVSKTNVIFSFKNQNEAILFNKNLETVENRYNQLFNSDYKFIALSIDEWDAEKKKFINSKNKHYEYLNENDIINNELNSKAKSIADDVFGENLIEME